MALENHYAQLPDRFFVRSEPDPAPRAKLIAWNDTLARDLGIDAIASSDEQRARLFSGTELPPGAEPLALAYAGHQFGSLVPQLGDGRALLLGDAEGPGGQRFDVQLKGSGRTAFSRGGDGKSALGPVVREYLVSEAMHHLGVPTTRALAAVATGESVYRDRGRTPGGILTRVAASHIRVGTFEYFAMRSDTDALRALTRFAIERHYPTAGENDNPTLAFFARVVEAAAALVAHWMDVGFVHGVMNTDNTAISGETLDYGPCAFLDEYHPNKVFSSIDRGGRYAFSQQAPIMQWNLARLAECLLLIDDEKTGYERELARFATRYESQYLARMRRKLGLESEDPGDARLVDDWLAWLQTNELDYTLSHRLLAERIGNDSKEAEFGPFEFAWREHLARDGRSPDEVRMAMNGVNPLYIARNHQIERAIAAMEHDDPSIFNDLATVLRRPFDPQPEFAEYREAPTPEQRVTRTFCGT